jgi:CheY-like chemotaxis protein
MSVRVLVVDDDPEIRSVVRLVLQREGFEADEAADVDALFASLDAGTGPDLILLDLTLPGPSGWAALARLKDDPTASHIPVVLLTAHDDDQFRAAAKSKGAAGYLTKPFKNWELVDVVRRNATGPPVDPRAGER